MRGQTLLMFLSSQLVHATDWSSAIPYLLLLLSIGSLGRKSGAVGNRWWKAKLFTRSIFRSFRDSYKEKSSGKAILLVLAIATVVLLATLTNIIIALLGLMVVALFAVIIMSNKKS